MSSLNRKINQNKTKHLLVEIELTTLENKIPDVSSLVKKTDDNTKIAAIATSRYQTLMVKLLNIKIN